MRLYGGLAMPFQRAWYDRGLRVVSVPNLVIEVCEYQQIAPVARVEEVGAREKAPVVDELEVLALQTELEGQREKMEQRVWVVEKQVEFARQAMEEAEAREAYGEAFVWSEKLETAQEKYWEVEAEQQELAEVWGPDGARSLARSLLGGSLEQELGAGAKSEGGPQKVGELASLEALEEAFAAADWDILPVGDAEEDDLEREIAHSSTLRFLRIGFQGEVRRAATDIALRRKPGRYGVSLGYVEGDTGQGALGVWSRLHDEYDVRLMAGGTFAASDSPGEAFLGLTFSHSKQPELTTFDR
jgi:hypothetical protein